MSSRILLIEDEDAVREVIAFHLTRQGFQVLEACDVAQGTALLPQADLVLLDWMLPDMSGIDVLNQWRASAAYATLPVLMLTARASEHDKVEGLGAGADDYLVKPFSTAELLARIKALLRRTHTTQKHQVGGLCLDGVKGIASLDQETLQLTRREFELLAFMMKHTGRVFKRSELLDHVWGEDFIGTERTVDQHIAQLRALIGADYIETLRGRGYCLVAPASQEAVSESLSY